MNNIEDDLCDLAWKDASPDLRERIFGDEAEDAATPKRRNGMSVRWSALIAVAAGVGGFLVGVTRGPDENVPSIASAETDLRVVETYSSHNSFDFSYGAVQILPGELRASIDGELEPLK